VIPSSNTSRDKSDNSFASIIRRTRIRNASSSIYMYAEYEIACQLKPPASKLEIESVIKWSVWRRYSEFVKFDTDIKNELGWRASSLEMPSAYTLTFNKFSPEFLEQRRFDVFILAVVQQFSFYSLCNICALIIFQRRAELVLGQGSLHRKSNGFLPPSPFASTRRFSRGRQRHNFSCTKQQRQLCVSIQVIIKSGNVSFIWFSS